MDEAYREWGEIQNLHGSSLMKYDKEEGWYSLTFYQSGRQGFFALLMRRRMPSWQESSPASPWLQAPDTLCTRMIIFEEIFHNWGSGSHCKAVLTTVLGFSWRIKHCKLCKAWLFPMEQRLLLMVLPWTRWRTATPSCRWRKHVHVCVCVCSCVDHSDEWYITEENTSFPTALSTMFLARLMFGAFPL